MPIIDGEPLSEDDFKALDEEIKIELSKSSEALKRETTDTIRKIREVEMDAENAIQEWEHQIALYAVGIHIDDLKDKYNEYPFVTAYLDAVKEDILKNIEHLAGPRYSDEQQSILTHLLMMKKGGEDNPYGRYKVNLLVDNSRLRSTVIVDYNPTFYNLMGRCEYENELGQ